MKYKNIFLLFLCCLVALVKADQEQRYTIAEMNEKSAVIADGEVVQITQGDTKELPGPKSDPVISTQYLATFKVERSIKGINNTHEILLEYWLVKDNRYRGEFVAELRVGDRFRLFADKITISPTGVKWVLIQSANAVRPEALNPATVEPTSLETLNLSLNRHAPDAAVGSASDIAVGVVQVSRKNGLEVRFKPLTVLKGGMQPGKYYSIGYDLFTRCHARAVVGVLEKIAEDAENQSAVIFAGWLHPDGSLTPDSFESAIWPRKHAMHPRNQTPDTLGECATFIKALLADPRLKLKIVNGRQMLPDGYTLPSASSATIKSDAATPKAQK